MRNLLATPFPRRPAPIRARARLLAGTATVALLVALCLFVSDVWAQAGPEQKPSNLTASLVEGGVQLNWDAPQARAAEVSGYQILRRRPDEGESRLLVLVDDTGSAATSYLDASATAPGVEYLYRVKARRGDELSGWTNKVRLTYSAPPPDPEPDPVDEPDSDDEPSEDRGVARISGPSGVTTRSVAENTAAGADIGLPVAATDVIGTVSYTLGGTDAGSFAIVSATGQLQTSAALDYETQSSYELIVTATDSTGSVDIMVTIDVTNVVEPATITGPEAVTFAENGGGRVATFSASSAEDRDGIDWVLAGDDARHFTIDSPPGALRFQIDPVAPILFPEPPDFEAADDSDGDNVYELTLYSRVGANISEPLTVTVTVTDVDEDGAVSLSSSRPSLGAALSATLDDPDGVTGVPEWTWERSAGRNKWAVIDGATSASYTPVAADTNTFLRVTATYDDEHGVGKSVRDVPPNVVLGPLLTGLSAETTASPTKTYLALTPAFDAATLHYRIGCAESDTITLSLSAAAGARVAVDGVQAGSGAGTASVSVDAFSEVPVTVAGSDGASTTYVLHCFKADLQDLTAIKRTAGAMEDLLMFRRLHTLVIVDTNGVPRFLRASPAATYFRFQQVGAAGEYRYSWSSNSAQVILDEDLNFLRSVMTQPPLTVTGYHDQRLLENGDSLLMAWEPATRDLSNLAFPDPDGQPYGTSEQMRDSAVQIVTPAGQALFTWNSWGNMLIEDCKTHRFPDDYAHVNGLQMVDGIIVASMRGCGKVLAIDPNLNTSDKVVWRVGQSNLSAEEWAVRDIGPAPLQIIGDPEGEFCGQHGAQVLPNGNLLLYDNGEPCVINPWTNESVGRESGVFSRAVEYAMDLTNGEVVFQRDHSLHGARNLIGPANGHVVVLDNGDWLISWGRGPSLDEVVTQVDPRTGTEKFSLRSYDVDRDHQSTVRATPLPPFVLAPQPVPLRAEIPASSHTSVFHSGATDSPQVVVSFSRPIVDFDETSPSLSVSGATVADVEPHVVAGEPAHAYLVTLTPDGDGVITFSLVADQPCAAGGICTADGTTLSEVPATPVTIESAIFEISITGPTTVDYEENRAVRVAAYSISPEPDGELTWSLSGADAGSFRIDEPGGVLRFDLPVVSPNLFAPQPDFEAPTDIGGNGSYEVTVEVSDGVNSDSLAVTVTISDQDEAGAVALSATRPNAGSPLTATLSDPDTVTGTPAWTWERSAGRNKWVTIAGANLANYTPVAADTNTFLRVTATYGRRARDRQDGQRGGAQRGHGAPVDGSDCGDR